MKGKLLACLMAGFIVFNMGNVASAAENYLYLMNYYDEVFRVLRVDPASGESKEVLAQKEIPYETVISHDRKTMLFRLGKTGSEATAFYLYDLLTGKMEEISNTEHCVNASFIKGRTWIVYNRIITPGEVFQAEIYDYQNGRVLKTLSGYRARASATDDSIYFMNADGLLENIYCYDPQTDTVSKRLTVELSEEGPYDVTAVIGLSKDTLFTGLRMNTSTGITRKTVRRRFSMGEKGILSTVRTKNSTTWFFHRMETMLPLPKETGMS